MKLAKKILACVIALALTACLGVVAFAADASSVSIDTSFNAETRELTIKLGANGAKETASLFLDYDHDAATFVSATPFKGSYTAVAGETADSAKLLSGSAMSMEQFDTAYVEIGTYVLKVKDGVKSLEIKTADGTEIDGEKRSASVVVDTPAYEKPSETTTVAPKTTEKAPETSTKKPDKITKTGDAGIAVIAGVSALAAVAFVVTKKK